MRSLHERLSKYADLLVEIGLNVQKGQRVVVNATTDALPLVRLVTQKAYDKGAIDVSVKLRDDKLVRLHAENQSVEEYANVPDWVVDERMFYSDEKSGFLSIVSSSPELLKGIDTEKLKQAGINGGNAFKDFSNRIQSDYHSWCVAGYPSPEWAKLVYPEKSEDEAVDALLDLILYTVRAEEADPVAAWEAHDKNLHEKADWLNKKSFHALRYEAPGTDLTIELPNGHIWAGASSQNKDGHSFMANMPTEEVFSVPKKTGVNGYVSNTLPLSYGGNLIDNFKLTFKDGKVVEYEAETGKEYLDNLFSTDEGAKYLGEVALVADDSPISNKGILFYNTLFDENASNHLAIGAAYPTNYEGGRDLTEAQMEEKGINTSITHEDFMIGSGEMDIDGELYDGTVEPIFRSGEWAF